METKFFYHIHKILIICVFYDSLFSSQSHYLKVYFNIFPVHDYVFLEEYSLQPFQPNISQGYVFPIPPLQTR